MSLVIPDLGFLNWLASAKTLTRDITSHIECFICSKELKKRFIICYTFFLTVPRNRPLMIWSRFCFIFFLKRKINCKKIFVIFQKVNFDIYLFWSVIAFKLLSNVPLMLVMAVVNLHWSNRDILYSIDQSRRLKRC